MSDRSKASVTLYSPTKRSCVPGDWYLIIGTVIASMPHCLLDTTVGIKGASQPPPLPCGRLAKQQPVLELTAMPIALGFIVCTETERYC